jgi:hypothetical protein
MLNLEPNGSNQTLLYADGATVLFSYSTPVAAMVGGKLFKTEKYWSVTTSKHIGKWLDGRDAEVKPQSYFDHLIAAKVNEDSDTN